MEKQISVIAHVNYQFRNTHINITDIEVAITCGTQNSACLPGSIIKEKKNKINDLQETLTQRASMMQTDPCYFHRRVSIERTNEELYM